MRFLRGGFLLSVALARNRRGDIAWTIDA